MTTLHLAQASSSLVRPVRFISVGDYPQVPTPLIRVTTCGLLTLEICDEVISLDPPQARYIVLTPDLLHGRGVLPALTMLKLLLSRPERFATSEWLREQFCQAQREAFSSKRLDTLAWFLRDLLCPPAYEDLRASLVAHTRALSGSGYRLASYPLIWVDHEALAWNVEQAIRMERFGDNPFPFWQRAYELARRGEYLPDEMYGDWASFRRGEVAGMLRQSVQALARLYADQQEKASEEEALRLLRAYWQEHPRDEDALRSLMELLARRDCYQEALEYYEKLCALLEEDEQQPLKQTQDMMEYVRTKLIQRSSPPQTMNDFSPDMDEVKNSNQAPPDSLDLLYKDILHQVLLQPGNISATFLVPSSLDSVRPLEDYLILLENEMTSRWMLYYTGGAIRASFGLDRWLQEVARNARLAQRTVFHEKAQLILCMGYQLQGCILRDMMRFEDAHKSLRRALIVAQELHHPEMVAATLAREGIALIQQDQPIEAASYLKRARELIQHLGFVTLEGYILQALSEAQAKALSPLSWESLDRAEHFLDQKSQVAEYSLVRFNSASVIAQRGVNAAVLHEYAESIKLIDKSLKSYDAALIRGRARLLMQKAEVYWKMEAIEACALNVQEAFLLAQSAGASKTIASVEHLLTALIQSPWGKEREIRELREIISPDHIL